MRSSSQSLSQARTTPRKRGISLHSVTTHKSSSALTQSPESPSSFFRGGSHRSHERLSSNRNPDSRLFMTPVLHINAFESFIGDSEGLDIFRTWIQSNQNCVEVGPRGKRASLVKLDRWKDELDTEALLQQLRQQSEWVHLLYYSSPPKVRLADGMPDQVHRSSSQGLLDLINLRADLASSRSWLLQSLYADEFQRFVTSKLVRLTAARLKENVSGDLGGLGEAFLLTNPEASDNPIVRASLGFRCLGRNFRFLYVRHFVSHVMPDLVAQMLSFWQQGPGTSTSAVQRIKSAMDCLRPHTELILSYRRDGTPFYCLLDITPMVDLRGRSTFLLVGQVSSESLARQTDYKQDFAGTQQNLSPTESVEKGIAVSIHEPVETVRRLSAAWIASLNRKSNHTTVSKRSPDLDDPKLAVEQDQKMTSSKSHTPVVETTYPNAIVFSRPSLSIVSASRGALMHLGIRTNAEYDASMFALSKMKITDLVNGSTPKITQILRSKILQAINRGEGVSCTCSLGGFVNPTPNTGSSDTVPSQNPISSKVHLTPLVDKDGALSSYVVIVA
ncbi:uncharacterized protein MELLADRAFT_117979 [Melampsora larici-populina 98AG31]|uniref:PAS domain-containing protein n=1 Tax=Melampsora larici-populina (strain 98AG31 / pathotype 3-4-7) TaxID=747676 RepID=F4S3P6_MELLP|nr:uncharacterized protein MELLADRAFT_117979 [Melampsora larici-populina 98AG31]EGG00708.1 hypothetical protein MELLADRAFT_117979 [Melampsora larici-populina 98AG31]